MTSRGPVIAGKRQLGRQSKYIQTSAANRQTFYAITQASLKIKDQVCTLRKFGYCKF